MFLAGAEAKLPSEHFDLLNVLLNVSIAPAAKDRDRLAHWSWAHSPELPDALILARPEHKMTLHFQAVHIARKRPPDVPFDPSQIFVITESDLIRLADRLRK